MKLIDPIRQLSGILVGEETLDSVLDVIVSLANSTIEPVEWASVSMVRNRQRGLETRSATSPEVREADAVQYETGEGPCVEAIQTGETINALLTEYGEQWPTFVPLATERGVGSILSTPLNVRDRTLGALNLYSRRPQRFCEQEQRVASQFAEHASVVLANAVSYMSVEMVNEQLQEALASRDVIGQAKGVIMTQRRCSADEAFDVLRRASQRLNRKLRDVAEDVVRGMHAGGDGA